MLYIYCITSDTKNQLMDGFKGIHMSVQTVLTVVVFTSEMKITKRNELQADIALQRLNHFQQVDCMYIEVLVFGSFS